MSERNPLGLVAWRTLKSVVRRTLNSLRRKVAGSRLPIFMIVGRDVDGIKVRRILDRFAFFGQPLPADSQILTAVTATLWDVACARVVMVADKGQIPTTYYRAFNHIFDVDFETNRVDGWQLCEISQLMAGLPTSARRAEAHRRLRKAIVRLPQRDKVYILGTGPSLERVDSLDLSDGTVIVCNTIVRDRALWHRLKPAFFVAADAIYHFGNTPHARAFRSDLRERLRESDGRTFFVYPELFDAIVQREFVGLEDLLIPIPFGQHTDIDVNLLEQFELPLLGNVLNVLLLPLACTLSKSVWLWGFDGRAPDDKLFWSNSNRHSYPELMQGLKDEHPAFFDGFVPKNRESSYVQSVHGDELDQRLCQAEGRGFEFVMMHFSWTETLNKRTRANQVAHRGATTGTRGL